MKHLVTGVAGFVGSNLARKLLDAGHHVTGLDNMSCGFMENIKDLITHPSGFNFQVADIRDWEGTGESYDAVWHLAARGELYFCRDNIDEAIDINIKGTLRMLDLAKKSLAKHFYFSDTSAEYDSFYRTGLFPYNGMDGAKYYYPYGILCYYKNGGRSVCKKLR